MSINRDIRDFKEKWLSDELLGISKDLGVNRDIRELRGLIGLLGI